ncbi:uncharacterized protein I303_107476 [Kwoniella dejecticola CBS 10117]|uniref:Cullin family profile domain-containing protein n=1 Tax=Kwoniella dejecticola CBS 10117 TaxID=1296121 RepID=A0A1A5ZZS6_9TREE|nr:uncharacterized protein I303_06881 [Kwoniella dejecticola CBS 10117]OBR83316.1 hypothetical protein I303_06881 [Kwoniella dejecticola CBS 10117]
MSSLIALPSRTDAFSAYQPSKNAHTDFISAVDLGRGAGGSSKEGVKKIRLSVPIRATPTPTNELLQSLLNAIPSLLSGKPTERSYHTLSHTCHQLVLQPHTLGPTIYGRIYGRIKDELEESANGLVREWRGSIMSRQEGWLARFVNGWKVWEKRVNLLSAIFVYLDRVYSNPSTGIASIKDLSILTFRKLIWENEIIAEKTRSDLLAWASSERASEKVLDEQRPTIVSITDLSKLLDTFTESIAKPYIELTTEHYSSTAETHVSEVENDTMQPGKFVEWVLAKVIEERERAESTLSKDVADQVVKVVRKSAGEDLAPRVIRRALDEAMDLQNTEYLSKLYTFSTDVNSFGVLSQALEDHLEARLKTLLSDPANDPKMIDATLKMKRFTDGAISSLFSSAAENPAQKQTDQEEDKTAAKEISEKKRLRRNRQFELEESSRVGFKKGLGSRQNAPAEWIAKHLDLAMRRGPSLSDSGFNAHLDEIIALIGFTKDKDVFKAFYSTQLAKRLLLGRSASDDMERNMIAKLQKEMGEEFTSGDIMMKDLTLSETLVKSYQSAQAKEPETYKDAGNFTANVLTESAWPAYPLLKDGWNFTLPPNLQSSVDLFTSWYSTQHKNRQLSWRFQLSTVTLTSRVGKDKYEIGVSLFQAVVLLLFNEEDTLDFKSIQSRTGIETQELIRTLQSLALGRKGTRVLLKKPPGKEVNPTDIFAWNKGFTSERIKFKINGIQQDMSAEESRKTNEQIHIDRVSVLEATIVRIMKGKKKLSLQSLIDNVVSDVVKRFPPDVKEIKKRVESLIEREFLMRDEEERGVLHYLA